MLSATELRNGTVFIHQNRIYRVIKYQHSHISRRAADIKIKAKDLLKGTVLHFNFASSDRFEPGTISRKKMQFLYQDQAGVHLMDPVSFEQVVLAAGLASEKAKYLTEGIMIEVIFWEDQLSGSDKKQAIELELPKSMVYQVKETGPSEKGDSSSNVYKAATMTNNLTARVPLFIKVGDRVKISTQTGEYLARVKSASG